MNEKISDGARRPWDFPMGSLESCAAARAMAERKESAVFRIRIVHIGYRGSEGLPPRIRVPYHGGRFEIVHVPGDKE